MKIQYLLFFHVNTGYMKAPPCYVYTWIACLVTIGAIYVLYNRPWFTKPGMLKLLN